MTNDESMPNGPMTKQRGRSVPLRTRKASERDAPATLCSVFIRHWALVILPSFKLRHLSLPTDGEGERFKFRFRICQSRADTVRRGVCVLAWLSILFVAGN